MKPEDFRAWRAYMGLSQRAAAEALDISHAMVKLYERGSDYARVDALGRPKAIAIPRVVEFACFALLDRGVSGFPPIGAELHARARKLKTKRYR